MPHPLQGHFISHNLHFKWTDISCNNNRFSLTFNFKKQSSVWNELLNGYCLPAQDYFQVMILNEFPSLHGEAKFHQSGTKGNDAMI